MKFLAFLFAAFLFVSCSQNSRVDKLSSKVDSLSSEVGSLSSEIKQIKENYKPGLGELMSVVQMHHAKLWFAGINGNWKLAEFEVKEISEVLRNANKIETDRPEAKNIPMIYPEIDSVSSSVNEKSIDKFISSFKLLTKTCNDCHKENEFGFNVITIPTGQPVTNQDFKPGK